jgi:hypothetical protein
MNSELRQFNYSTRWSGKKIEVKAEKAKKLPDELIELFDMDELTKYYTEKELAKGGN